MTGADTRADLTGPKLKQDDWGCFMVGGYVDMIILTQLSQFKLQIS
jgi:hypothetical protein